MRISVDYVHASLSDVLCLFGLILVPLLTFLVMLG